VCKCIRFTQRRALRPGLQAWAWVGWPPKNHHRCRRLLLLVSLMLLLLLQAGGTKSQRCRMYTGYTPVAHVSGCRQHARCTHPQTQAAGRGRVRLLPLHPTGKIAIQQGRGQPGQ
jgi:hypothetical protein